MDQVQLDHGSYQVCSAHGVWSSVSFFSNYKSARVIANAIYKARLKNSDSRDRPLSCPNCRRSLKVTTLSVNNGIDVDQCYSCNYVWFDIGELESIHEKGELESEFPEIKLINASQLKEQNGWPSASAPPGASFHPLMLLGLPVEEEERSAPFSLSAILIILACTAVTIRGLKDPSYLSTVAFDPRQPLRDHGLTLLTSIFAHAGWAHLIGNSYFLYICADNIEEVQGPVFLCVLFFISAFAGDAAYVLTGGRQLALGASGGVAGIMSYYAMSFPKNRFSIGYFVFFRFATFSITAPIALLFFFSLQLTGAWFQWAGFDQSVGYTAHLAGLAVGFLAYSLTDHST